MLKRLLGRLRTNEFPGSARYWENRYAGGGNSGAGSYGRLAEFKARILNDFVRARSIASVIEFGCGDGNQAALFEFPSYTGVDVSETAVVMCRKRFARDATRSFLTLAEYAGQRAELALSLDVLYHLIEEDVFHAYIRRLFSSAERYVAIYSSNMDAPMPASHVKHREFTSWITMELSDWKLHEKVANPYPLVNDLTNETFADFYIYRRTHSPET